MPTLPATCPSQGDMPLALAVAWANVLRWMYRYGSLRLFNHTFDPESDPEGEAPEEIQTLWLQQDVSEWLVCLNNVSLFLCVVTVTTM